MKTQRLVAMLLLATTVAGCGLLKKKSKKSGGDEDDELRIVQLELVELVQFVVFRQRGAHADNEGDIKRYSAETPATGRPPSGRGRDAPQGAPASAAVTTVAAGGHVTKVATFDTGVLVTVEEDGKAHDGLGDARRAGAAEPRTGSSSELVERRLLEALPAARRASAGASCSSRRPPDTPPRRTPARPPRRTPARPPRRTPARPPRRTPGPRPAAVDAGAPAAAGNGAIVDPVGAKCSGGFVLVAKATSATSPARRSPSAGTSSASCSGKKVCSLDRNLCK